jgi:hypothetical protein
MNVIEVVLVASSVINVILLVLVFIMYANISTMKIHLTQVHAGLGSVLGKMLAMEQVISKLAMGFSEFVEMSGNLIDRLNGELSDTETGALYRTIDGKYSASSLEELMEKIKGNEDDRNTFNEDIDRLKNIFEDDDTLSDEDE